MFQLVLRQVKSEVNVDILDSTDIGILREQDNEQGAGLQTHPARTFRYLRVVSRCNRAVHC